MCVILAPGTSLVTFVRCPSRVRGMTCNILVLLPFYSHLFVFRVLRRRRTPYASGLAMHGLILAVRLQRGAVCYILALSLSTSYRVVLATSLFSVALHITYLFFRRPVALLLFVCVLFPGAHKSLAASTHFPRWFGASNAQLLRRRDSIVLLFFVSVLNFATSPNSGVKFLGGFLRSERTIFRFIFSGCASFSWFFIFLLLRSRDTPNTHMLCFSFFLSFLPQNYNSSALWPHMTNKVYPPRILRSLVTNLRSRRHNMGVY